MNSYITFHCGFELCCIEMCGTYHMSLILKMYAGPIISQVALIGDVQVGGGGVGWGGRGGLQAEGGQTLPLEHRQ